MDLVDFCIFGNNGKFEIAVAAKEGEARGFRQTRLVTVRQLGHSFWYRAIRGVFEVVTKEINDFNK
jgi:hypothetical protein